MQIMSPVAQIAQRVGIEKLLPLSELLGGIRPGSGTRSRPPCLAPQRYRSTLSSFRIAGTVLTPPTVCNPNGRHGYVCVAILAVAFRVEE